MTKVLFVTHGMDLGGIEKYLLRLLLFSRNKITAQVLCKGPDKKDWYLEDDLRNAASSLEKLRIGYLDPIGCIKLYKKLRREEIDAICDFTGDFSGGLMLAAWLARVPVRVSFYRESEHQFKPNFFKSLYVKFLRQLVLYFSTSVLSNSKAALDNFFGGRDLNDAKVIDNGVAPFDLIPKNDARKRLGVLKDVMVVGHVGRFTSAKNHQLLFKLAEKSFSEGQLIHFVFCGAGVDQELSLNQLEQANITAFGIQKDVALFLSALDVFVFPSLNEGQPNALIEAIVSGVPVLASNIPSIKEVLPACYHNLLCDPNDVDGFYSALVSRTLIQGDQLVEHMRQKFNETARFDEVLEVLGHTSQSGISKE